MTALHILGCSVCKKSIRTDSELEEGALIICPACIATCDTDEDVEKLIKSIESDT
jgi:hypothetical protein